MPPPEVRIDPPSSSSVVNELTVMKPNEEISVSNEKPSGSSENGGKRNDNNERKDKADGGGDEDKVVINEDKEEHADGDEESEDELEDDDEEDGVEDEEEDGVEDEEEDRVESEIEDDIKIINELKEKDGKKQQEVFKVDSSSSDEEVNSDRENYCKDNEGYKCNDDKHTDDHNSDNSVYNIPPFDIDAMKAQIFASSVNPYQLNIAGFQVQDSSNEMKDMTHARNEESLPPDETTESIEDLEEPQQRNSNSEVFDPELCYICRSSHCISDETPNIQQQNPPVVKKRVTRPDALIQCDYCSLLYHLDCLDPPLTALPIGKWMCPKHLKDLKRNIFPTIGHSEQNDFWNSRQYAFAENHVHQQFRHCTNPRLQPIARPVKSQRRNSKFPTDVDGSCSQPAHCLPKCINPLCAAQDGIASVYVPTINWCSHEEKDFFLRQFLAFQLSSTHYLNSRKKAAATNKKTEYHVDDKPDSFPRSMSPQCYPSTSAQPKSMAASARKINSIETSDCINEFSVASKMLNQLDSKSIRLLAKERLQQLESGKCYDPNCSTENMCWASSKAPLVLPAKALVAPVNTKGPSIRVCYNQIWIGHGAGEFHVNLHAYGHCNFVSDKHACIYYDAVSERFELINYSEYGTYVNGNLYLSMENSEEEEEEEKDKSIDERISPSTLSYAVRKVARSSSRLSKNPLSRIEDVEPMLSSFPIEDNHEPCKCESQFTLKGGFEHVAILDHGYIMQFGCLQFVFSLVDNGGRH